VVGDAAVDGGIPWVDATPFLRDRADKYEQFRALDGHWTPVGHRAIAELLADRILELGFIDAGAEK
jgi:lysophospholipase L1-like esterase